METQKIIDELLKLNCSNHGCVVYDPGGMRTNGICQCTHNLKPHELTRVLRLKNALLDAERAEVEWLRELIDLKPDLDRMDGENARLVELRCMTDDLIDALRHDETHWQARAQAAEALLDEIARLAPEHVMYFYKDGLGKEHLGNVDTMAVAHRYIQAILAKRGRSK